MKLVIFFVLFAVSLTAVLAEPEPYDGYSNNNYQRKNVRVIVERREPVQVVKKIVEVRRQEPRKIVVVKQQSGYGSGYGSNSGGSYGGSYGSSYGRGDGGYGNSYGSGYKL